MIKRFYDNLNKYLHPGKVLIIYGPRQVGKTTLVDNFLSTTHFKYKKGTGDDIRIQKVFSSYSLVDIQRYVEDNELIFIDEAQNIPNVEKTLKLAVDQIPNIKIIITGSSSLELNQKMGYPLVGRSSELLLYPVSQFELQSEIGSFDLDSKNEDYLIYGGYPVVLMYQSKDDKISYLQSLVSSYLLKDILAFDKVKSNQKVYDLLRLLAFQVGAEVSLRELASNLNIDYKTVEKYIGLLEKSFVLFRIGTYSNNLRNEIKRNSKYYFYDLGIRNALINNFNGLNMRNDVGGLWENFLMIERKKRQSYLCNDVNTYFWRYNKKEVDYIEEGGGKLYGYEFKYSSSQKTTKGLCAFQETYSAKVNSVSIVTKDNYIDFVASPRIMEKVELAHIPNGRYLLQMQNDFPYLRNDLDKVINIIIMGRGSKQSWKDALKTLEDVKDKIKDEGDKSKFITLVSRIYIM